MDGGVGYTNHPTSCDRFVVCYPTDGGNVKPVTQLCPYGLFWSQTALTCRLTKDVYCPHGMATFYLPIHRKRHIVKCYITSTSSYCNKIMLKALPFGYHNSFNTPTR